MQPGAESHALDEVLAILAPFPSVHPPTVGGVRQAARERLALERQQSMLRALDQDMQRILPPIRDSAARLELGMVPMAGAGVSVEESLTRRAPIMGVGSGTAGFAGVTDRDRGGTAVQLVTSWSEYERLFGSPFRPSNGQLAQRFLPDAVRGFFANGGTRAYIARVSPGSDTMVSDADYLGESDPPTGLAALATIQEIRLLLVPGVTSPVVQQAMVAQCETHRDRVAILDLPLERATPWAALPLDTPFAAAYWPWITLRDASGGRVVVPPSGAIAGQYARLPAHRAPRNEPIAGAIDLSTKMSAADQSQWTAARINPLRLLAGRPGPVVWGVRTLSNDPDWRFLPVRRQAIYLERSLVDGLHWTVFEPSDETLWRTVVRQAENFLVGEWRSGALLGTKSEHAFFVKCDRTTMTQADIAAGRLVVAIGFAPIRPGEFVIIRINLGTAR